jgi:glutamate carboxypeptidase
VSTAVPSGAATLAGADSVARAVYKSARAETDAMLEQLSELVDLDSPTYAREHCDRVARVIAAYAEAAGARVELIAGRNGLHVHAQLHGRGQSRVALLCHHDTVFPVDTVAEWGFSRDGDRVHGPGVCDMKGGIVVALQALRALAAWPEAFGVVELVSVPDEEERNGPPETVERLRGFDAALCMECGREDGSVVSERKGGLWTRLVADGRAAHAGTQPDAGRNAVGALAAEVIRIHRMHNARPGLTAQVTRLCGGTAINTVPARAELVVDVRATTEADLARTPAMERTRPVRTLAAAACALGRQVGQEFGEASTGGSSDAAWTAGMGVPTIDGLGPVGGLDHTRWEYAEVASFAPRAGVTAGLIAGIGAGLLDQESSHA